MNDGPTGTRSYNRRAGVLGEFARCVDVKLSLIEGRTGVTGSWRASGEIEAGLCSGKSLVFNAAKDHESAGLRIAVVTIGLLFQTSLHIL